LARRLQEAYAFLRASASFEIAILKVVFFWMKAVGLYFISAIFALLVSLVISFCAVRAWAGPDDDSPGLGMLAIFLFVVISSLIVPLFLGVIAELLEHKVLARRFSWLRSLRRVLLALPIGVGPWYALWVLVARREDARPPHWLANMIVLLCTSLIFGYLALRIRRQLPGHSNIVAHS
jgi:hypothetical protein